MFDACKRRYYYNYYGSWGGWEKTADPEPRLLYRLKKITTLPQLIGTVVHATIDRALKALKSGQELPVEVAEASCLKTFDQRLQQSERGDWKNNPSRATNLFEHYYDDPSTEAVLQEIRPLITRHIRTFYTSDLYLSFKALPSFAWLSQETLDSFIFGGHTIWVTLDLAVHQNDKLCIYDWKTGTERAPDKTQLAVYALYASKKLHTPLENLILTDFYLKDQRLQPVVIDGDTLEATGHFILESIEAMQARLSNPTANTAEVDQFPMTDHTTLCKTCPFKAACYPDTESEQAPTQEPEQLGFNF